jgi:type IV pilus assembly protein PilX
MLLLLMLTLIGLVTATETRTDSRVTSNTLDRAIAFQAAEAALREAEARLMTPNPANLLRDDPGFYTAATEPEIDYWPWRDETSYVSQVAIPGLAAQPRYVIDQLRLKHTPAGEVSTGTVYHATDDHLYRVTAASVGRSTQTLVVLQTTFIPPSP